MSEKKDSEKKQRNTRLIAVVMLKGTVKIRRDEYETLSALGLKSANNCVILPGDESRKGMLRLVQKYVTWGEISNDVLQSLLQKKLNLDGKIAKTRTDKAVKSGKFEGNTVFRLKPPTGGLKSVRIPYPKGDSGYRGDDINNLLKRMI